MPDGLEALAAVLESRHGALAADMAEFFSAFYRLEGHAGRSEAWAGVADVIRGRTLARLAEP